MSWWGPWYGATEAVAPPDPTPDPEAGLELAFVAGVNGTLYGQAPDGSVVVYDGSVASPDELFSMRVVTGTLRPGGPPGPAPLAWGRVRSVGVNGKMLDDHTLRVRVKADDRDKVLVNKSEDLVASNPAKWPYGLAPEIRTTSQRCAFFKVELIATPAAAEWTSIDVWAAGSNERAPSRTRS